jgi:uncharacterized protein (DUF433 family)
MVGTAELLNRRLYTMAQVDELLGLTSGSARRWIDGYVRAKKRYPPVVRVEPTGDDTVTWGEFVETRLLAEYRGAGVPMVHLRPAVDRLRTYFDPVYPLASARAFLDTDGRELVRKVQEDTGLTRQLLLVVVRNNQVLLAPQTDRFVRSAEFGSEGMIEQLHPTPDIQDVVLDPRRQFGVPVVRSVPTDIIAEQLRAGDGVQMIADLYDLTAGQVEAAIRYELIRRAPESSAA